MTSFDTSYIWDALAEDGKIATSALVAANSIGILTNEEIREALVKQLHAEARAQGVSLRINRSDKYDDLLHIYLRKGN